MPSLCRSFNPVLKDIPFFPTKRSSLKSFINPKSCQMIIDKLDLKKKYPDASNSLDIVDVFPGFGLFSSMLNYELKPRNHVIMEDVRSCKTHYEDMILFLKEETNNRENFIYYPKNGYKWETFTEMVTTDNIIAPEIQSNEKVHSGLLVVANLLGINQGEALFAQWIMCSAHRNWLQKYGRVKMICAIPEHTAMKFLSGPGFSKRNRSAIKREMFTDTKLIAISEIEGDNYMPDGYGYDPNLLIKDQPLVLSLTTISPSPTRMAIVEVDPKQDDRVNIDSLDYVTQILMYRSTHKLSDALKYISPGAAEDLCPQIPHLLDKCPRDLSMEELEELVNKFDAWPFKPSLQDRMSLNPLPEEDL